MPRTVEHIVACHKAASERRATGKPIWDHKININSILCQDQANESPEYVAATANRIAALLRAKVPACTFDVTHGDYDQYFVDAVEAMEQCTVSSLAMDAENGDEAVDVFNGWLDAIYDWADANRVWLRG